jgi:hypothetical protein
VRLASCDQGSAFGQHLRPDARAVLLGDFDLAAFMQGNHGVGIRRLIVTEEGVGIGAFGQRAHGTVAAAMLKDDLQQ